MSKRNIERVWLNFVPQDQMRAIRAMIAHAATAYHSCLEIKDKDVASSFMHLKHKETEEKITKMFGENPLSHSHIMNYHTSIYRKYINQMHLMHVVNPHGLSVWSPPRPHNTVFKTRCDLWYNVDECETAPHKLSAFKLPKNSEVTFVGVYGNKYKVRRQREGIELLISPRHLKRRPMFYRPWDGDCGELMTVKEYLAAVDSGLFMPWDGYGQAAFFKNEKYLLAEYHMGCVSPNEDEPPSGATHVIWYNK